MRVHFIEKPGATETLCGAPMPARFEKGVPNAPNAVEGFEAFERINPNNQCIKCRKLIPRLKRKKQLQQERAVMNRLREETWEKAKSALLKKRENQDMELSYNAHEMVFGVPCGPVLSMVENPRAFIEKMEQEVSDETV